MKANELRVGNLVYGSQKRDYGTVENVDILGIIIIRLKSGHTDSYSVEELNPIPLTEESLRKLGLEHKGEIIGRLKLDCDFGDVLIPLIRPCEICKYVHQLQNLYFASTGEELIINKP